jgi:nitrite reductase/ring-hydroxylating ferredoxin subunit
MRARRRVELTPAEVRAVRAGRFVRVELGAPILLPDGLRARSAFVGRAGARVVAWANRCQHNPVPLDAADDIEVVSVGGGRVRGAPLSDDRLHIMCQSHGALYRPSDGLCVLGPCYGQRLFPIDIEDTGGKIALVVRD